MVPHYGAALLLQHVLLDYLECKQGECKQDECKQDECKQCECDGQAGAVEENLYIAYVSSALRLMYSKIAKAAMHEFPWNAKPTLSSASVISETLYADKIDYFFLAAGFIFLPPVFSLWPPLCASSRAPST